MGGKEMRPGKEGRNYLESKAALQEKILVPSKGLEPPHRCRYMDLNHARLPIPPRWQSELQCSGGPKAAVSGRLTYLFLQPVNGLSNHLTRNCHPEQAFFARRGIWVSRAKRRVFRDAIIARLARFASPASPSSKSSRSAPSTPGSPSPPLPRISETLPHPLPEPSPQHRCGSM